MAAVGSAERKDGLVSTDSCVLVSKDMLACAPARSTEGTVLRTPSANRSGSQALLESYAEDPEVTHTASALSLMVMAFQGFRSYIMHCCSITS